MESCPSSPLFIPLGMERSVQRTRRPPKEGSGVSTDSEDMNGSVKNRKGHKRQKGRRSQQGDSKGSGESRAKRDTREEGSDPTALNQPRPPEKSLKNAKEHSKENAGADKKVKAAGEGSFFPVMSV